MPNGKTFVVLLFVQTGREDENASQFMTDGYRKMDAIDLGPKSGIRPP
jgi:hypothetical protein